MRLEMRSNASSVTWAEGPALHQSKGASSKTKVVSRLDEPGDGDIHACRCLGHAVALDQGRPAIGAVKHLVGRLGGGECICLVHESANGDAHLLYPSGRAIAASVYAPSKAKAMSAAPTPAPLRARPSSRPDIRAEIGETLKLAGPAIIARAGMLMMSIADTVMVGQYDTAELAYLGLAWSLSTVLLVANIGLLMGTLVKTSQAFGRKDYVECGRVWRRAMPLALDHRFRWCVSCAWRRNGYCLRSGRHSEVAAGAAPVTIAYGVGLIPIAIAVGSQFFPGRHQAP